MNRYHTLGCFVKDINYRILIATAHKVSPLCPKLYQLLYIHYFIYYFDNCMHYLLFPMSGGKTKAENS